MSKVSVHKLTKEMMGNAGSLMSKVRTSKEKSLGQIEALQELEREIKQRIQAEKAEQAQQTASTQETVTQKDVPTVEAKPPQSTTAIQKEPVASEAPQKSNPVDSSKPAKAPKEPKVKTEKPPVEKPAEKKATTPEASEEKKAAVEKKPTPKPTFGLRVVKKAPTEEEKRAEEEKRRAEREKFRQRNKERQQESRRKVQGRAPQGQRSRSTGGRPQTAGGYNNRPPRSNDGRPPRSNDGRPPRSNDGRPQGNRNAHSNFGNRPSNAPRNTAASSSSTGSKPASSNYARRKDKTRDDRRTDSTRQRTTPANKSKRSNNNRLVYGDVYVPTGSRRKKRKKSFGSSNIERIKIEHAVVTGENVSIKELSEKIGRPGADIIKQLLMLGIMANINQFIDFTTAELVAAEFDVTLEQKLEKSEEEKMMDIHEESHVDEESQIQRAPIVTVMGHVDHGKTSLLDAIRKSDVLATEAGGITQHIGAYTITHNDEPITFIDTPGHEAFTAMRARGAQVTDIAILVVAADDGVMPQTVEAINHAKAAGVPIIVAINKMDLPAANPNRVMQELTEHEIVAEEWGGDSIMAPVSAITGEGLDNLLEMIILQSEILELQANPSGRAVGTIIESRLEIGRGPVATVLVKNGTLHVGDSVVAGQSSGRVRAMTNDKGERVDEAGPSTPVEVIGLSEVPDAGDEIYAADDRLSRKVAQERKVKHREDMVQSNKAVTLDELFGKIAEGQIKDLNLIVKADVQGSAEAVRQSLEKLSNEEVRVKCIHVGVGAITEYDVLLASASNAIIIGFNVRPDNNGRDSAARENVEIRTYRIIYNAIEDVEKAMKGMLEPEFKEVVNGHAQVRNVFKVTGVGNIAGCYVTDGKIKRSCTARIVRDGVVIYEGNISSLKRFKDDVREVATNYECGIGIENFNDIKDGDVIEAFETVEIER